MPCFPILSKQANMQLMNALENLITLALNEDIGRGDITTQAVPENAEAIAEIVAKEDCILSCSFLVPLILTQAKARARSTAHFQDGQFVSSSSVIFTLRGNARDLLTTERTILNFLQRTCGVATLAAKYKKALGENSSVKLLDTRKTTPGFRALEKQAVKDGGLYNHRASLDAGVLIKENHIRAAGSITQAMQNLEGKIPQGILYEVEVVNLLEAFEAIETGANALLLDNFSASQLREEIVPKIRARAPKIFLEASGGIILENLQEYAVSGVDAISIGALTHSVRAVDLSMLFQFPS